MKAEYAAYETALEHLNFADMDKTGATLKSKLDKES